MTDFFILCIIAIDRSSGCDTMCIDNTKYANMNDNAQVESPFVAVDAVIFTVIKNKLNVLLIKIKYGPFAGAWGVPGGKVRMDESLDEAARRELFEKTRLKNVYLEQLYSFGKIDRDPRARIISVAYFSLVNSEKVKLKVTGKYEDIKWSPLAEVGKLAYDHNEIIEYALSRLKNKLRYTNVIYSLLQDKFTLSELQRIYEITLQKKMDKRNFRKKMLSSSLIKEAGVKIGVPHRPSKLYSFRSKKPVFMEMF